MKWQYLAGNMKAKRIIIGYIVQESGIASTENI
jgi:hypothetical protein